MRIQKVSLWWFSPHQCLAGADLDLVQVGGDHRKLAPGHVLEERHGGQPGDPRIFPEVGQSLKELGHWSALPVLWPDDDGCEASVTGEIPHRRLR